MNTPQKEEVTIESSDTPERDGLVVPTLAGLLAGLSGPRVPLVNQWPANYRIPGRKRSFLDKTRQARKRQRQARKAGKRGK